MLEHEEELGETGSARSRFQVANVRLDGCDVERIFRRAANGEYPSYTLHLAYIAGLCAGTVRFYNVYIFWGNTATLQELLKQLDLGGDMRLGYRTGRAALIHLYPANNTQDAVILGTRIGKALQHEQTAAFSSRISISRSIENLALAGWTQEMATVQAYEHLKGDRSSKPMFQKVYTHVGA